VLRDFAAEHGGAIRDSWVHPGALVPVGEEVQTSGWRLDPASPKRHGLSAWLVRPEWLDAPPSRDFIAAPGSRLDAASP
jgi:hypothetical protein